MLRNFIVVAWRNIDRNKLYAAINVVSLSIGITACLVIYLIVHYEFSFDNFHPDKERIYRIAFIGEEDNGNKHSWATGSPVLPTVLREEVSGIEKVAAFYPFDASIETPGVVKKTFSNEIFLQDDYITTVFTGPSCFDIFRYEWLAGNPVSALSAPFNVVITESKARLYFGSLALTSIIGKEIIYDDSLRVRVSGIVRDWVENSDLHFTDFISLGTITSSYLKPKVQLESWKGNQFSPTVFVKLEKGTTSVKVNSQFHDLVERHKVSLVNFGDKLSMHLQSLKDIHFTGDFNRDDGILHWDGDSFRKAHLPTLYGLMGGGVFVLIIAIVNFINLSTALSFRRAKEIGVRKVLGSSRKNIVAQFLVETFGFTFIALVLSVLLVNPVLSALSSYIPNEVKFEILNSATLFFIFLVMVITSLFAGFYPAKILSSFLPALSLKGVSGFGNNNNEYLRKGLVVFQFTISLIFIIGAVVIGTQIRFIQKELTLTNGTVVNLWGGESNKAKILASKIKQLVGVNEVALQIVPPLGIGRMIRGMKTKGKYEMDIGVSMKTGNEDYIPLYGIKLLAGRNFSPSDSLRELVINQSYCRIMGFSNPEEALGQMIFLDKKQLPVIGVVEDFHEGSLHEAIGPIVIANVPEGEHNIAFRVGETNGQKTDLQTILLEVEKQWKLVYPDKPFNYSLLDDDISVLYAKEERAAKLIDTAMMITIFISCIGVFGLSMFSAQVRTKEIGIRKVLGATISNIVSMLSREFILLILIAVLISSPIAWYFMNNWLQDFAYHITISWWVFFISGLAAMAIALVTISFQSIKAALANPVDSLRSE